MKDLGQNQQNDFNPVMYTNETSQQHSLGYEYSSMSLVINIIFLVPMAYLYRLIVLMVQRQKKTNEGTLLGKVLMCFAIAVPISCLLYTSPSPRDKRQSRMPSSA